MPPEHLSAAHGTRAVLRAVGGASQEAGLCSGVDALWVDSTIGLSVSQEGQTKATEPEPRLVEAAATHWSQLGVGSDGCGGRRGLVLAGAQTCLQNGLALPARV